MEICTDAMAAKAALVTVIQCKNSTSFSAHKGVILNRLWLLPKLVSSLVITHTVCQVTPHFYFQTYSGQLRGDQITNSTS